MKHLTLRTAKAEESAEVANLILSANPHLGERIRRFLAAGGQWHDATPVVCEVDGRLWSCAVVFRREIWTRSARASFGGIGAVATHPAARGRGYATRLIQYCEDLLAAEGVRLGILFASIVEFYERLGWFRQPEDQVEFCWNPSQQLLPQHPYQLRLFGPEVSLQTLARVYEQVSAPCGGALVRCEGIWKEYLTWQREDLDLFWIAYIRQEPVAFVRARRTDLGLLLQEATCVPEHSAALLPLLNQQAKVVNPAALTQFRSNLARHHPLASLLDDFGVGATWSVTSPQTSMLMAKELTTSGGKQLKGSDVVALTRTDFGTGLPWQPRTWWAVDRF